VAISLPNTESMVVAVFQFKDDAQRTREQDALVAALQNTKFYSEDTARQLQPLKLRTFKATSSDSVSAAARTIPQGALQTEFFRALNGLAEGENLRAGVWYKTVIDPNI
jgi:predicted Zn-dependent protease